MPRLSSAVSLVAGLLFAASAAAHDITAPTTEGAAPAFDIVHAKITAKQNWLEFHMHVDGRAGASRPDATGKLEGSRVFAYVWPTKLDSSTVGFEPGQGVLSLAVTSHPDFDDTPLFDENGDGDFGNDGAQWHSHWVVLVPDEACGPGALKVKDIPEGATPRLPATWPGFPILLDSPGYTPVIDAENVVVRAPFHDAASLVGTAFDAVTSGLRVNANLHNPLLCVTAVYDVASGDLSLPGRVAAQE